MSDDIMVDFLAEVEGYLPEMRSCLAHLHQEKNNKQALEELHRITHTIKGAAAMVGLEDLSKTGGLLEQLMDEILDESRVVDDGLLDFFSESTERLAGYCTLKRAGKDRTLFQETSAALEKQVPEQGSTDSIAEILDQLLSTEVEEDFFLLNETVEGEGSREEEDPHLNLFFQQRKAGQAEQEETEEKSGLLEELFGLSPKEEILSETENSDETQIFAEQEEQLEEAAFFDGLDSGDDTAFLFTEDASEEEDIFSKVSEEFPEQEQEAEAIDPELLECFAEEADEHLSQIARELKQLTAAVPQSVEISPPMREQLHVLRRAVHTLKGAAAVIGIESIAAWGRDFEDCLDWLHDEADRLDPETVLTIQRGSSVFAQLAQDPAASSPALIAEQKAVLALFQHIQASQAAEPSVVSEELLSDSQEEDALPEAEEEFIEEQLEEAAFFDELAAEVPDAMEFLFAEESPAIEEGEEEDIFPKLPEPEEIPIQEESEQVTKEVEVAIDPELLECFTEEADEHLSQIDTELNQLTAAVPQSVDISPSMREHLHVLRRAVHTLKGAAAVIGIAPVAAWGHDFEDFLDWLHDEADRLEPETILALRQGSDLLAKITEQPLQDFSEKKIATITLFKEFMGVAALNTEAEVVESQQNEILPESQPLSSPESESPSSPSVQQEVTPRRRVSTLRVDVNKIDQVVGLSGDMVINLSSFESSMTAMSGTLNELGMILQRLKNINSSLEAGYELASIPYLAGMSDTGTGGLSEDFDPLELDRYSELNILIRSLSEAVSDLDSIMSQSSLENIAWQKTVERQARVLKEIQNRMIGIRMTPLSILATRMQRTVREAERTTGHSAELIFEGESIMMDTRVWDTMADPLMHILRNAVAHGGSPEQQDLTIRIKALRQGGLFFLRISDNGKGLNYEAIRKKGIKLYPTEGVERMRQEQLAALIFRHGFSSTSAVSNIAGRGVGMDVVRDAVEQLNGSIQIYSEPGQGLELLIRLPVAVAQLHVVMTRLAGQVYAVPMHDIDSVVRVHAEDLVDTSEYLTTQGERLPLLLPSNIPGFQIGMHDFLSGENEQALLLVHSGTYRAALLCDQILGQRDVVFKDLGAHLSKVPCIAGVTIMGDGRLIPILQTEDLLKKWQELSQAEETFDEGLVPAKPEERPLQILVVDDSISVRKVVSNFILQQGWQPIAARNGIEALERIREEKPDFVLLDVEMPRMNGFEVLQSLQSQPDFRDIPVAMLTSRSAEKYREKARQLGAKGFVTKPFKAEEIFDLIHRLTSPEKENV